MKMVIVKFPVTFSWKDNVDLRSNKWEKTLLGCGKEPADHTEEIMEKLMLESLVLRY